jgi:hypothetical protein
MGETCHAPTTNTFFHGFLSRKGGFETRPYSPSLLMRAIFRIVAWVGGVV